jgi:catechol 2,3-dioxygenase-like lactoylglutathione lyase family enzyme
MIKLEAIDHIALAVRDVEHAARWYIDVLGFERQHEGMWNGIPVFIGLGATAIALFPTESATPKPANHAWNVTMLHFALRTDRANFLAARCELRTRGIKFHSDDHGIARSIYFRDPDGHEIEITTYELDERQTPNA